MTVVDGLSFLGQLDFLSLVLLFWHMVIFDIPRYMIGAFVVAGVALAERRRQDSREEAPPLTVSVVLPGHNEAAAIERAVVSVREQTLARDPGRLRVVVVDDGSNDGMAAVVARLQSNGMVDTALAMDRRGGKSAAVNLAVDYCDTDIVIIADADTSFDRGAFEAILRPFADPAVGAVAGNLGARNMNRTLIARWQAVEYLIGISLGRRLLELLGILVVVSGAFGAFRREALRSVGGQSVEVGEDADLTTKLRRAGWKIRFAPDAWALTDVPETVAALVRQRLRWDRSVVTLWVRKFRSLFDPRSANFSLIDALGAIDVLFFQIGLSAAFVAYVIWLFWALGALAWIVLIAGGAVYMVLALISFLVAALATGGLARWQGLLPDVIGYSLFNAYVLRLVRLVAYLDELIFRRSYRDPYVPRRVMDQVERF